MSFDFSEIEEYEKTHPLIKVKPDRHWPERVKKLRKVLGYTQEDLALFLGCTMGSVYKWEAGKCNPTKFYQSRIGIAEEKFVLPVALSEQSKKLKQEDEDRINGKSILEAGS